jgi:hypothetical protein
MTLCPIPKFKRIVGEEAIRRLSISLILLILFLSLVTGCNRPQATREEFGEIDVSQEPSQIQCTSNEPIIKKNEDGEFTITPVAEYKIAAIMVSRKRYHDGWRAEIAPVDLALAWGKLADPEYDKYITYSQSDRWYFYGYKSESPFNNSYVIPHSANNHIIPADENIYKAIKTIKKKQKVILEGFLVNVKGLYKGENFWWNSSLKRTDSGDGSCELFYVKKVRIGTNVYV